MDAAIWCIDRHGALILTKASAEHARLSYARFCCFHRLLTQCGLDTETAKKKASALGVEMSRRSFGLIAACLSGGEAPDDP